MANGDFNLPTLIGSYRSDFLDQIRTSRDVVATMFDGSIAYSNQPLNAVQFISGAFNKWSGSTWVTNPVAVAGGGTGSTTAADARTNLSVYSKAEIDTLSNNFNTAKADKTITISASNGLSGGGDLSANRTISAVDATTSAKGVVQLNNTVTSTSTTQAATANAVRLAAEGASSVYTLGGDFTTSDDIRVAKSGRIVTISSIKAITHASSSAPSSNVIIPVELRPVAGIATVYTYSSGVAYIVGVTTDGRIGMAYRTATGDSFRTDTGPDGFTISYSIA